MDRGARHVVASRGGNRHTAWRHTAFLDFFGGFPNAPNGLNSPWRKSYVYLRFRSYFRTGRWPDLFPSVSLPLSPYPYPSPIPPIVLATWLLSRSLTSPFITLCLLLYLCSTSTTRARSPYLPCAVFSSLSRSYSSLRPSSFSFPSPSRLPIFIFLSTRSFIRARFLRTRRLSFIHSTSLSFFGSRSCIYSLSFSLFPFLSATASCFAQPTNLSAFRVAPYTCQASRNCETTL